MSPQALNEGEYDFIWALRSYLYQNPPPADEELYLLRNQSRLGVGFHSDAGSVFPDFILWIKRGGRQHIVFVEPHGMRQAPAYDKDAKARLHETLADINRRMAEDEGYRHITMDSYVVSQTPYDELRAKYGGGDWTLEKFREKHILFPRDKGLIARILGRE